MSLQIAVVLALATGVGTVLAGPYVSYSYNFYRSSRCEPIDIPMCKSMPWNNTSMPNLVHQSTQRNARLLVEQYEPLVWTNCSQNLAFFLCAMYVPICLSGGPDHEPIQPCRDVCAEARRSCEPIVLQYNRTWPELLACDDLPEYDKAMCMSPRGFTGAVVATPPASKQMCKCKTELKFHKRDYHRGNYSYAMLATMVRQNLHEDTGEIATVMVPHVVFRDHQQVLSVGRHAHLWTPEYLAGPCNCVELVAKKRYFVACHGDPENGRLLLEASCTLAPWHDRWPNSADEQTVLEALSDNVKKLLATSRNGPRAVSTTARSTTATTPTHRVRHGRNGTRKPKERSPRKSARN